MNMQKNIGFYLSCMIMAVVAVFTGVHECAAGSPDFERLGEETVSFSAGNDRAMDLVLDLFKPLDGTIVDVENGIVRVQIDDKTNIMEGMRFTIFRKGEPFHHPLTNELIGETENIVGRIEVIKGKDIDGFYLCSVIEGEAGAGDTARISSSKIKLAFFQDRKSNWSTSEVFYNALKESGRFEILESYAPVFRPTELSHIAVGLGAEAVMVFTTPVKNNGRFLNVKLYWAKDAKLFKEIEEPVGHGDIDGISAGNEFMFTAVENMELLGSYNLTKGRLLAVGDVDSNGTNDFVISDGKDIRIFNVKKDELHELWHIKGSRRGKHISLDVLDLNMNGTPEIFVTSIAGARVSSFVLEYGPSGYQEISSEIPYFFRVLDNSLLMQKFSHTKFFNGPVYNGEWSADSYHAGGALELPSGLNIYGFTYVDWQNNGHKHLMTFDDDGYLNLYDGAGEIVWESAGPYDMADQSFKVKRFSNIDSNEKWIIRGNLVSVPTDRGHEIIAIKKIPNVKNMPGAGSRGGEVYSLWWDGASMDETLIVNEMYGSVTDFQVEGRKIYVIAKSSIFSLVKNVVTGEFSRGSLLYYFNLGDK